MLKLPIKASRIANLTDARYFAAWEVEWLGFCLDQSAEYFLQAQEVMAIKEWITGPQIVGEFGWQAPEEIIEIARLLQLDAVQVGPLMTPDQLLALKDLTLLQEWIIEPGTSPEELRKHLTAATPAVDLFLLNFSQNATTWSAIQASTSFGVEDLAGLCRDFPILLDWSIPAAELESALEEVQPKGLSLQGGVEEKVGVKSFDELDELLEVLEVQV